MAGIGRQGLAACILVALAAPATGLAQTPPMTPDITGHKYEQPAPRRDFERREVMIPMRDGVKLFTVIMIPKGAHDAPMLFTRTPYNAAKRTMRTPGATRLVDALFDERPLPAVTPA